MPCLCFLREQNSISHDSGTDLGTIKRFRAQGAKVPLNEYEFPASKIANVQSQLVRIVAVVVYQAFCLRCKTLYGDRCSTMFHCIVLCNDSIPVHEGLMSEFRLVYYAGETSRKELLPTSIREGCLSVVSARLQLTCYERHIQCSSPGLAGTDCLRALWLFCGNVETSASNYISLISTHSDWFLFWIKCRVSRLHSDLVAPLK